MLEPQRIVEQLASLFETGALAGVRVLVTAGPTQEDVDPVRFLGNRSSGKMGFAVARAAYEAGATVTVISGPVAQDTPPEMARVDVRSAQQMYDAVMKTVDKHDIFIAAAAVADYRPRRAETEKIKKSDESLTLELVRNPDIVASVAALPNKPFTVGFAAETHELKTYAQAKLRAKNLDLIAANLVAPGQGFESDENALLVLWPGGEQELARDRKERLARALIALIAQRFRATRV
jgi:phosphopantothenoylcysteine decarboxylase/phosphopantothenate--cysteine ligase